jgi:hypothetical protein
MRGHDRSVEMSVTRMDRIRTLVEDPETQEFFARVRDRLMPDGRFEFGRSPWIDIFVMASACVAVEEAYDHIWERLFP